MNFELGFVDAALKEWQKLDHNIREQFKKKLAERCENLRVPSAKLSGSKDRYKIKLRGVGYPTDPIQLDFNFNIDLEELVQIPKAA